MTEPEVSFAHDAFISYSRKDKIFAARLERALEEFKPPRDLPVPQRHLDIFRDEGDFTGTDYFQAIESHLGASRKLIVVCSPASAGSPYVDDEIERFVKRRGAEHLIPVLLAGVPNNEAAAPEDLRRAFPPALMKALVMPLAGDWRGVEPSKDRMDRGAFASAWFKLLAELYGVSRTLIEQRELRRQARNRRITIGITGAVIVSLGTALAVSLVFRQQAVESAQIAQQQRDVALKAADAERQAREAETKALDEQRRARAEAEASRDEAERQEAIAKREAVAARRETAERLAVQAVEQLAGRPERALSLAADAIRAYRSHGDPLVPAALGAAMKATLAFAGGVPVLPQADTGWRLQVSENLLWAAQADRDGNLRLGEAGTSRPQSLGMPALPAGWSWTPERDVKLGFGPRHLVAMRQARRAADDARRVHVIAWPLLAGARRPLPQSLGDFELENWSGWMKPELSADGRWVAWPEGYRKVFIRALAEKAETLELFCGLFSACKFGFSPDSRWFVAHGGSQGLLRHALPAEADEMNTRPQRKAPIAAPRGEPAQLAFFAGRRPDGTPSGPWRETARLAWLGIDAEVAWWDLTEETPARHDLPGLIEPFRAKLQLSSLSEELVESRLEWHPSGGALLAEVRHPQAEFGFAAVNMMGPTPKWQPLWHRYDGKALSTSSRLSGGPGGATGYRVIDSAELGVQQAVWTSGGGVLTLGFDGTVWFRDLDTLDANRFQLVDRDASALVQWARWIVIGGRDGTLRWWNMKRESTKPLVFNGLDAAVQSIRIAGRPARLVATDAHGVARGWPLGHPGINSWLDGERDRVGRNHRWWITRAFGEGLWLWTPETTLAPPLPVPNSQGVGVAVAVLPDGQRALMLRAAESTGAAATTGVPAAAGAASGATPMRRLRLEHWRVDSQVPQLERAAVQLIELPGAGPFGHPWLLLPRSGTTQHIVLGSGTYGERPHVLALDRSGARPVPIGPVAEGWQLAGSPSADLRWLPMKSEATALRPPRVGLVDLSRAPLAAGHHGVHALPAEIRAESTRLSDDGSWAVLDLAGYRQCVLPLALPLLDCIVVPRNSKGEMLDVQFVHGQPPLAWRPGAPALRWQAGRFVPTLIARNLSALAWDNTGLWRAEAADGRGVTLRREHSGAVALRLPAAPAEVGTIERLFPFPGQGWVFASNGRGSLVAWNRDAAAGWQAPFVLDAETLREARGPYSVRLADADRTLVVDGLPIALDAERLLRETMRLASGRSVDPATRR